MRSTKLQKVVCCRSTCNTSGTYLQPFSNDGACIHMRSTKENRSSLKSWDNPNQALLLIVFLWKASCLHAGSVMALPCRVTHLKCEEPKLPTSQFLIYHIPPFLAVCNCTGIITTNEAGEQALLHRRQKW